MLENPIFAIIFLVAPWAIFNYSSISEANADTTNQKRSKIDLFGDFYKERRLIGHTMISIKASTRLITIINNFVIHYINHSYNRSARRQMELEDVEL